MKQTSKTIKPFLLAASLISLTGYYFALFMGNERNLSWCSALVLILIVLNDSSFIRQRTANRLWNNAALVNSVLCIGWIITVIPQILR